jgi:REP element-mobilizing transposase RayT
LIGFLLPLTGRGEPFISRPLRIEYPGAYYHVIQRGNERGAIFTSDRDRKRFLTYLEDLTVRYHIIIHTYCLMENHYHLLTETPEANLSKAMHTLNTSYTAYYNKRRGRIGHLFQGRYKSILVQGDGYLHHLSRYIHLNPVRANLVKDPKDYVWSSYRSFISKAMNIPWLKTNFILSNFDKDIQKARGLYKKFVLEGIGKELSEVRNNLQAGFILGNGDFFQWVRDTFIQNRQDDEEIPVLRQLRVRITPEKIKETVDEEIKNQKVARKLGIYLSHKHTGRRLKEIAGFFGKIGDTGVSQIYNRVEKARERDKSLDQVIRRLEKEIM